MNNNIKLLGGKTLISPKGLQTRPTTGKVREALINILKDDISDCSWLDLYSGTGSISCEAIQSGAFRVLSIEGDKKTSKICLSNIKSISINSSENFHHEVIHAEVIKTLKLGCKYNSSKFISKFPKIDFRFDFVYLDPPFNSNLYEITLENLILGEWIKEKTIVICEYATREMFQISNKWKKTKQKNYGNVGIVFLTPNPA